MSDLSRVAQGPPPEQQAIRARCLHPSGSFVEFKKEEIEQSIPSRFEKIVRKYPDRIAVKSRNQMLTYDELNQTANRIARAILAKCSQDNEPIALLFEHGIDAIAAIFGALKAGKCFLSLDPSFPLERITYMLEDSQTRLIATNNRNVGLADKLSQDSRQLLNIDLLDGSLATVNVGLTLSPDTFGYLIYTSGSTGKPKGVAQNHRNILHGAMRRTNAFRICTEDRLSLLSSGTHQAVMNIFSALLNGAGLCSFNVKEEGATQLVNWLIQEKITIYHSSASLFRQFVSTLTGKEDLSRIRLVRSASETVTKGEVGSYRKHFSSDCLFTNGLGTTETGTSVMYFIDKDNPIVTDTVPIGYPLQDMEILLLDDDGREVGFNCVGEIAVRSCYLSPGYWRRPDLTQAKFRPDPAGGDRRIYLTGDLGRMSEDGCLEHLGRKDFQVKVRGYRIEVSEIEVALLDLAAIKEAVVVAREDRPGYQRLIAYIVPAQGQAPTSTELRRFLKAKLPEYMVPSTFVFLEAFPLTPNGKVDRLALPAPEDTRPELDTPFAAPTTPVEEDLARIWAEVLSLDQVGIHDSFFDLGGHSLAATRVVSQVIKQFLVEVPLQSLFQSPTVAEMSAVITENQAKSLDEQDLHRILAELDSLSDEDAQQLLADQNARTSIGNKHE